MIDMGMKKKQRRNKAVIDEIAATIILRNIYSITGIDIVLRRKIALYSVKINVIPRLRRSSLCKNSAGTPFTPGFAENNPPLNG